MRACPPPHDYQTNLSTPSTPQVIIHACKVNNLGVLQLQYNFKYIFQGCTIHGKL